MKRGSLLVLTAVMLTGCASFQAARTRSMEEMLGDAGFETRAADTPEALAYLRTLPAKKLIARSSNGQTEYGYADPTGCQCLYVGTELQYQELRKLSQDQTLAAEQRRDVERADAFYGLWGGTWPPPLR